LRIAPLFGPALSDHVRAGPCRRASLRAEKGGLAMKLLHLILGALSLFVAIFLMLYAAILAP
jgi:hypothetical protein